MSDLQIQALLHHQKLNRVSAWMFRSQKRGKMLMIDVLPQGTATETMNRPRFLLSLRLRVNCFRGGCFR